MSDLLKSTPAVFWRAFLFWALAAVAQAASNFPAAPELAQLGKPDAAEARDLLEKVRGSTLPGKSYLEFELHALPRRGDERVYRGRLWSSHNGSGAITRVQLTDGSGQVHRWLLQNGAAAAVWTLAGQQPVQLPEASVLSPLIPGVDISAFDLLMPYLYWPDAGLSRLERIRGRPAYTFVFQPPLSFQQAHPEVGSVRAYLDTQYRAITQAERIGPGGQILSTLSMGGLKRVNDQWMLKSVDFRNDTTRDKTRLLITAAALDLDLSPALFEPARLAEEIAPPRADRIVRFTP